MNERLTFYDCSRLSSWWMAQTIPFCTIGYLACLSFFPAQSSTIGAYMCLALAFFFLSIVLYLRLRKGLLDTAEDFAQHFPRFLSLGWLKAVLTFLGIVAVILVLLGVGEGRQILVLTMSANIVFYHLAFWKNIAVEDEIPARKPRQGSFDEFGPDVRSIEIKWTYSSITGELSGGKEMSVSVKLDAARHEEFINRNKMLFEKRSPPAAPPFHQWADLYAGEGLCPETNLLAVELYAYRDRYALSELQQIELFLAAVQSIPYSLDEESTGMPEYPRYPIETMADATGDCEDTAILLAALLLECGFEVALMVCSGTRDDVPDHMACGVKLAYDYHELEATEGYVYCETTANAYRIGEKPDDVTVRGIYPVELVEP